MTIEPNEAIIPGISGNGVWRRVRKSCAITLACAVTGALIGAADGAATALSAILYRNPVYVGAERLPAVGFWALGASGVGAIAGVLLGLPVYYGIFAGRASARQFINVAVISLIGGVIVCLATGEFVLEFSWLATPLVAFLAALAVARRRVSSPLS